MQRAELEAVPDEELDELAFLYVHKGLSVRLAREVAQELTKRDALAAHAGPSLVSTSTMAVTYALGSIGHAVT